MKDSGEANAVLDAAVVKKIAEHYRHARRKHPHFADALFLDGDNDMDSARRRLAALRQIIEVEKEDRMVLAETLLECELAEAACAYAGGDKAHAVEECYDAIAVLLRMEDVLEGRQKLGNERRRGMKRLDELGVSPAPWRDASKFWVADGHGLDIAEMFLRSASADEEAMVAADARLIAAAPDLYEALRLCMAMMCEYCRREAAHSSPGAVCDDGCAAMLAAKAALEKAGGKEWA